MAFGNERLSDVGSRVIPRAGGYGKNGLNKKRIEFRMMNYKIKIQSYGIIELQRYSVTEL